MIFPADMQTAPEPEVAEALSKEAAKVLCDRFRNRLRSTIDKALGDKAETTKPDHKAALFYYGMRAAHARRRVNAALFEDVVGKKTKRVWEEASQFRKAYPMHEATSLVRKAKGEHGARHDRMFEQGQWRRYYPMPKPRAEDLGRGARQIINWLEQQGYTEIDYIAGTCVDERKQTRRIGRCLPNEAMKQSFANDSERQGSNLMLVISRHPYDLIRMSTQRGWESCMSRNGMYFNYVPKEVEAGSMVAYLISKNDPEILDPMARSTLKPFVNSRGETVMKAGPTYGMGSDLFKRAAQAVLDREYNAGLFGDFQMAEGVYNDGMQRQDRRVPPGVADWSAEQWIEYLGLEVQQIGDRKVIRGDLKMDAYGLTSLPDFSAYEVDGTVNLDGNELTSLKGCPKSVSGDLMVGRNKLGSLEGCTQTVSGSFFADHNQLTSLEGGPTSVGKTYSATNCGLTTLRGAPEVITGAFDASMNRLTTLTDGGPTVVIGRLDLHGNQLSDLKGLPRVVAGEGQASLGLVGNALTSLEGLDGALRGKVSVDVSRNEQLTSLQGCPGVIEGSFSANSCGLTTLEGGPYRVSGGFTVTSNKLTSLKGAPSVVGGLFEASRNRLDNLVGMPTDVGKAVRLRHCGLTSLQGMPAQLGCGLDVMNNELVTLQGMAERIDGEFNAGENKLETLEGMAQAVTGRVFLNDNRLSSTRGLARHIGNDLYLDRNGLTDLKDMPRKLEGRLSLPENQLTTTEGLPERVRQDINLRGNPIVDATRLPAHVGRFVDLADVRTLKHLPAKMPEGCSVITTPSRHLHADDFPSRAYPPKLTEAEAAAAAEKPSRRRSLLSRLGRPFGF